MTGSAFSLLLRKNRGDRFIGRDVEAQSCKRFVRRPRDEPRSAVGAKRRDARLPGGVVIRRRQSVRSEPEAARFERFRGKFEPTESRVRRLGSTNTG